jgi:transposase
MSVSPLLPNSAELRLRHLVSETASLTIVVETARGLVPCPECQQPTRRIHNRYIRTLADLPWSCVTVRIRLHTRKFFCASLTCPRRIFTERLPATAARYARRTKRLAEALQVLGFALGGEASARLGKQLGMWTSPDALLDRMRQAGVDAAPTPRVRGVDDWAWRKGHSYGTILVDLERRCVVDLLPDRHAETLAC